MGGLHVSASGFEAAIDGANEYMQAMQDLQAQLKRVRLDAQSCPDNVDLSQNTDT